MMLTDLGSCIAAKVEQAMSQLPRDRSGVLPIPTAVGGDWDGMF